MAKSARSILDQRLAALQEALASLPAGLGIPLPRFLSDAAALRFHLAEDSRPPVVLALLGGTGTGKSTLTNRLLGTGVSATSFRRTFTAGPVAITPEPNPLPDSFLGWPHHVVAGTADLPAKGEPDRLTVVPLRIETVASPTPASPDTLGKIAPSLPVIIDTPDLDGDRPQHHAQADRVFRWSQAVLFLVTPEKYQMTELVPYYRLARRYALPCLFVMNKCEQGEMLDDYRKLLAQRDWPDARAYAIPRDDAAWDPPADANLDALRAALAPLSRQRAEVDSLIDALHSMETPPPGVDVSPVTQQLQRRLQQRSVLYLIGPQRILDRARQVPGLLARLPRTTWDLFRGKPVDFPEPEAGGEASDPRALPDFPAVVTEQFALLQTRIDDLLRSNPAVEPWLAGDGPESFDATLLDPALGGAIAQQEIEDLNAWLERRWNSNPRDTRLLMSLLRRLPGAKKLSRWSEAAPYLLTVVLAAHHALFGHVDLMILGGYTLATWLT
jgi:hypothetical protein